MIIAKHAEDRAWAFESLEELQKFLTDPDFEGDADSERDEVTKWTKELREGKYRVVVVGTFNVGKSALINAFLGDDYLPTVLEECTTKVTTIIRGEKMTAMLHLSSKPSAQDIQALHGLLGMAHIDATITMGDDSRSLTIAYRSALARDLVNTLRALVTMNAEDDFPKLKTLRNRLEEVIILLPTELLEEDVALVDSPGAHSMTESNKKLLNQIIPQSHLVICMVDSQNAGNEQNIRFIESIVRQRHRKVFFVLNKADQLNEDEIDALGQRGPAKDLLRALKDVLDKPELFFVSSLYAGVASQLEHGRIRLADLAANRKIRIPFDVMQQATASDAPEKIIGGFLSKEGNVAPLKERLFNYLYKENREGAILESVCRFMEAAAWRYARPVQVRLDMARQVPRLDELAEQREKILHSIDANNAKMQSAMQEYRARTAGGKVNGQEFEGITDMVERLMTEDAFEDKVIAPIRCWLNDDKNLGNVRRGSPVLLAAEIEIAVDVFAAEVCRFVEAQAATAENATRLAIQDLGLSLENKDLPQIALPNALVDAEPVSLWPAYFGYTLLGAIIGAGAGIWLGGLADDWTCCAMRMGGAIGAVIGIIQAWAMRLMTVSGVLRDRLMHFAIQKVRDILLRGGRSGVHKTTSYRDLLLETINNRMEAFAASVHKAFAGMNDMLNAELVSIQAEEGELRAKQAELLQRLEPKAEALRELALRARAVAEANAPIEEIIVQKEAKPEDA